MKAWMPKRGIAFRMISLIFLGVVIVTINIFAYFYRVSRATILANLKENSRLLTVSTVTRVEKLLTAVQKIPTNLAPIVETGRYSRAELEDLLALAVEHNPELYGLTLGFEPSYLGPAHEYSTLFVSRENGEIRTAQTGIDDQSDHMRDWYLIPRELQKALWSEPYYDEGRSHRNMVTYSVPLYGNAKGTRTFIGILAANIALASFDSIVSSIKVHKTGYAYTISRSGILITHPKKEFILNTTIFSLAEENNSPVLHDIGRNMVAGRTSFAEVEYHNLATGKLSWLTYAPITMSGWSLGIVYPVDELTAPLTRLFSVVLILALAGAVILLPVVIVISRSITGPLRKLAFATHSFGQGNFDVQLPPTRATDEIGELTRAFAAMQNALKETINHLEKARDELEEYNRTLEEKVEKRTAELTAKNAELDRAIQTVNRANNELKEAQAQLIQTEKMASLGQLTAGIAHEIKNPLNFVNNFSELSIDISRELHEEIERNSDRLDATTVRSLRELLADLDHNVRKINEHGKRADSIVKGMLLHSRGKAGEKQKTNLNDLLNEDLHLAYHGFRAQDSSFNVAMQTSFDPALPPIDVVPQNISRVFLNIINNGCYSVNEKKKETGESFKPLILVSTKNYDDRVEIRIRDNGKGIPRDITDKIFNPFFTTKPTGKGTGLGLSLSYDIVVQEHKGELRVDSEPGEFAEFIITLRKT